MRFQVISLPHTQITKADSWCAYTQKVRRFVDMLRSLGHEVIVYASEQNESDGELVTCITEKEQRQFFGPAGRIPDYRFDHLGWRHFIGRVLEELRSRVQPGDFVCHIAGLMGQPVANAFPNNRHVEFGVGYEGVFAPHRVYESYAWQHAVEGRRDGASQANGQFYDTVIPNYFTPSEYPEGDGAGDYLLFVGRLVERKGLRVVLEVAKRCFESAGIKTIIAGGHADREWPAQDGTEYVGSVGPEERSRLMAKARALIAPTLYLEPFGGVAVEAQFCGTYAITTDWGAFPETVVQGWTGWRCRDIGEFCWAVKNRPAYSRAQIALGARGRWSTDVIKNQYLHYFERLKDLDSDGFYTKTERAPGSLIVSGRA